MVCEVGIRWGRIYAICDPQNSSRRFVMRVCLALFLPLVLPIVLLTVGTTTEAAQTRAAYTKVTSPADCIAKRSTTPAECEIKAEKCLRLYDIPMSFFQSPCSAKIPLLGCQCANRCNRER
jgi:hypothetical protein